jgi:hypothetical protein
MVDSIEYGITLEILFHIEIIVSNAVGRLLNIILAMKLSYGLKLYSQVLVNKDKMMDSFTFKDRQTADKFLLYVQQNYDTYPAMQPRRDGTVYVEWSTDCLGTEKNRRVRDAARVMNF